MDLNNGARHWALLEDIVKCSVCHVRLTGNVFMCESGHSICHVCKYGSLLCTQCHKLYTAIPNLLAQNLLSQLDDIKRCLMELDELKLTKNKNNKSRSGLKNKELKGQYPCLITADCKFHGFFSQIIEHTKNCHPHEIQELGDGVSLPYKQSWEMIYGMGNNLNRMINIPNIGLFILQLLRNGYNELEGCVVMYAGTPLASKHYYKIEIECGRDKISYMAQVGSARIPKHNVPRLAYKGFFIDRNQLLYNELNEKRIFYCSITLERKNENFPDEITSNNSNNQLNQHGKKHFNKRKNVKSNHETSTQQSIGDLEKNYAQQNQSRSNNVSREQSTGSKSSVQLDINAPWNKSKDATKRPEIITQQSSVINQLSELKQFNPNSGAYEAVQNTPGNFIPAVARHDMVYQCNTNTHQTPQMFNNYVSSVNIPTASAPYEVPPPINPYFQQQALNLEDTRAMLRKNGKKESKCIVT